MNNEERLRILRMVASGKLSPTDAEELLDELEPETRQEESTSAVHFQEVTEAPKSVSRQSLVIRVVEGGQSKVDVRIPFALAQAAGAFLPGKAQRYLAAYGVSLENVLERLGNLPANGSLIHVEEGNDVVHVAVE